MAPHLNDMFVDFSQVMEESKFVFVLFMYNRYGCIPEAGRRHDVPLL